MGFDLARELLTHGQLATPPTPEQAARRLREERNNRVITALLSLLEACAVAEPPVWPATAAQDLEPALSEVAQAGVELLNEGRWQDTGDRERVLNGNRAHELLLAIHAYLTPLRGNGQPTPSGEHGSDDPFLKRVYKLAFEPLDRRLPPRESSIPSTWRRRLAVLSRLAWRLVKAERAADARSLLLKVADVLSEIDPNPRAKWKDNHANQWRPPLREFARQRRHDLVDLVVALAPRDEFLARHLIEVLGQELSDASPELREIIHAPDPFPDALRHYARQVAEWAGRVGRGRPWPDLLTRLQPKIEGA